MLKEDLFVTEMKERFSEQLNSADVNVREAAQWFVFGSQQYEIEEQARQFLNSNPNPTPKEMMKFFDDTAPDGLPPCASEWDDDDDEDDE